MEKTIYDLTLHETLVTKTVVTTINGEQEGRIEITRVPGGWVYVYDFVGYRQSPIIFVPYNEEFKKTLKESKKIK